MALKDIRTKVPEKYRKDYRDIKRVLSTIKKTGTWHKKTDLIIVKSMENKGYVKYIGKKKRLYQITAKGNNFLLRLKKLIR